MEGHMVTLKVKDPDGYSQSVVVPSFIIDRSKVMAKVFKSARETDNASILVIPADCEIQHASKLKPLVRWLYTNSMGRYGDDMDAEGNMSMTEDKMADLRNDLMAAFDVGHRLDMHDFLDYCATVAEKLKENDTEGDLVRLTDMPNYWLPLLGERKHDMVYKFLVSASAQEWVKAMIQGGFDGEEYWTRTLEAFPDFANDVRACAKEQQHKIVSK